MKKLRFAVFFFLTAMTGVSAEKPDFARVLRTAAPASAWITTDTGKRTGAGFFIRQDGYLATFCPIPNCKVVLSNGQTHKARLVGKDPATGLAVLQIPVNKNPVLPFATEGDLKNTQWGIALGGPHPRGRTSAIGKIAPPDSSGYIRTNAVVNQWNAGGPLLDSCGRIIGMNIPSKNVYYTAIPGPLVQKITGELICNGFVKRPYLGILVDENMKVQAVAKHSPAADSLDPGDQITKVNDRKINNPQELLGIMEKTGINSEIFLEIRRGARELSGSLILRAAPGNWWTDLFRTCPASARAL